MKASRYNKFFDSDDETRLAYNCLTSGLATLTKQKFRQVQKILSSPNTYQFNTKAKQELRDKLIRGGFLVEDSVDEIDILKVRNRSARFDKKNLKLTILPTLRCNFRCIYCYEARKNITMSPEIQKGLVEFVKEKTEKVESLTTNWYGGEPLMALDAIEYLRNEFEKICAKKGVCYNPGGIITNGYLLTRVVAKRLKQLGIESVQITLDGPKDVHDQRRPLADGRGTFDAIMDNVCQAVEILKTITIRVNTDKTNADRVVELLDVIEKCGLKGRVGIYFAKVTAHTEACANFSGSCFKEQEYSDLEVRLTKLGLEKGFNLIKYPRVKFNYCQADQVNAYVVGPTGYLYKCWSCPGNTDEAVGHVSASESDQKKKNIFKWLAWDVFDRKECCECDVLPICMGGCPYIGLKMKSYTRGACEEWRHNLLDMLRLYYTNYCRTSQKASETVEKK